MAAGLNNGYVSQPGSKLHTVALAYRPELDGLRAIAVLPVLLFHAGFSAFAGGFVGVDIFFVLSGYLITRLIHADIETGSFSLLHFYERRARRILPALFVVAATCIPFAWQWMLPQELAAFSGSLMAVGSFSSNLFFWLQSGYFAAPSETIPLLHTWSLAVEEQFYLFFPLVLLACRSLGARQRVTILALGSLASLVLAEYATWSYPSASFYLMPTRAWELGAGALLALREREARVTGNGLRDAASVCGIGAITYSIICFDSSMPHPGVLTLIPVGATLLLIASATPQTVVGRILGSRPLVAIGLVSYSAYLWHQPLFAFARIRLPAVSGSTYLGLIGTALILAYLSWRFLEQPLRTGTLGRKQIFTLAACSSTAILAVGVAGQLSGGFPQRMPAVVTEIPKWAGDSNPKGDPCAPEPRTANAQGRACLYGSPAQQQIVLIGDSHAEAVSYRLSEALNAHHISLRTLTKKGCPPIAGLDHKQRLACERHTREVQQYLLTHPEFKTVIFVTRWAWYLEGTNFNNGEGGVEGGDETADVAADVTRDPASEREHVRKVGEHFRESIELLLRNGKRVVLIYPIPEVGWNVPTYMMRRARFGLGGDGPITTSYEIFKRRNENVYAELDELGDRSSLLRVYPAELFCNSKVPGRCIAELDGKPLYRDDDHLNYSIGSRMVAEQIVSAMNERHWLPSSEVTTAARL